MADLLPCPFCGGSDLHSNGAWIACGCSAFGPTGGCKEEAVAAWNTRAGANPITDALREKWPDHVGTDAELLRDLLIRVSGRHTGRPRWSNVAEMTPHGSGYSSRICRAVGLDPDEVMPCPDEEEP